MKFVCWRFGASRRLPGLPLALFLIALIQLPAQAEDTVPHVLMLHAYDYSFPATAIVSDVARKRLLERLPAIEIEAEFLDLARRSDPTQVTQTADYLKEKYVGIPFDALVVVGIAAVPFAVAHHEAIAPGAPMIFAGGSPADLPHLDRKSVV